MILRFPRKSPLWARNTSLRSGTTKFLLCQLWLSNSVVFGNVCFVSGFAMKKAQLEEKRPPRIVRVAAVQNPIYAATDESIVKQYKAIEDKVEWQMCVL